MIFKGHKMQFVLLQYIHCEFVNLVGLLVNLRSCLQLVLPINQSISQYSFTIAWQNADQQAKG